MLENDPNNSHTDETESVTGYSSHPKPPDLDRLGSFKIEATISTGGMGTVYRAYDESMKRTVALKVLHPSLEIAKKAQERFAREAWIAGQLEHPNVIKVYSRGEENRLHYIAMELADGGSLADLIKQMRESIPSGSDVTDTVTKEYITSILRKFIDLADALEHIHSKGFIHRDIKPHNVLISGSDKHFKLTDFGIAHAEDMTHITKAGDFIGTVRYMSPELLTAHRAIVDKRTDIYSLGVTLYEALTLTSPFEADSEEKFILEILCGHAIPARKRNKRLPRDLETVLMKATHQDSEKRYQSAAEFADDLQRILECLPVQAKREWAPTRVYKHLKRNRKTVAVVLLTVLIIACASYWYYTAKISLIDKQRITKVLQTAMTTRTSPFDIDPEWSRLSKILYKHVRHGQLDSIKIWYFKVNNLLDIDFSEYSLFRNAFINISPLDLDVFGMGAQEDKHFAAVISRIDVQIDQMASKQGGMVAYEYGTHGRSRVTLRNFIHHYVDTLTEGRHSVKLTVISEHFLHVSLFTRENSGGRPTIVGPCGDSLSSIGAIVCDTSSEKLVVLTLGDLSPANPMFVDTLIDSFYVWILDEYPDDFPKAVSSPSIVESVEQSFTISGISVIKTGISEYMTIWTGLLKEESLKVPIAARFLVKVFNSDVTVLEGGLRFHTNGDFDILYHQEKSSGGLRENSQLLTRIMRRTSAIDTGNIRFPELSNFGQIKAKLILAPSIDVARYFGDAHEFCGDTLVYDIEFQAFDSSNTQ